jgi:lipopolysaccharide transport system ATP-binding protein
MSSEIVISVESLSKRYRLGQIGGTTLREDVSRWWARLRGRPDPTLKVDQVDPRGLGDKATAKHAKDANEPVQKRSSSPLAPVSVLSGHSSLPSSDFVWALKDVSFEVERGEVLGIIGRNGAGKSTLLKILSRITAPTSGQAKVRGRIASLLEVGTGMHGELTGRENIFLNGAILGMTRAEITGKLDEIIDFSGVERFIDTPVKRYSSGMMVRLGFAVAAHLEPEILIVDEVLAVGDAEFQKKCLGKMSEVAHGGRTVLFVSHNMAAVGTLTQRCLVLQDGGVAFAGDSAEAIALYTESAEAAPAGQTQADPDALRCEEHVTPDPRFRFLAVRLADADSSVIPIGGDLRLSVRYQSANGCAALRMGYTVRHASGTPVLNGYSPAFGVPASGQHAVDLALHRLDLAPGKYDLCLSLNTGGLTEPRYCFDILVGVVPFHVSDRTLDGSPVGHWNEGWGRVIHAGSEVVPTAVLQGGPAGASSSSHSAHSEGRPR